MRLTATDSVACFSAVQWQVRHQSMVAVHVTNYILIRNAAPAISIAVAALCTCMHICNLQYACGFVRSSVFSQAVRVCRGWDYKDPKFPGKPHIEFEVSQLC